MKNSVILLSTFNFIFSIINEDSDYWFPFPTVSMDYSENCSIDMSYLNWKIEERIKIKNGHFYYKDKRVKFFGTNVAFDRCFPEKDDAPKISKRLAQIGINVVRFHQMDNKDIWLNNTNSTLSKDKLDRLHYFLYCLKQNGIYANINLHVGRTYPEMQNNNTLKGKFTYGKSLDRFYPPFIEYQKNYSRDLLTSFNNYTNYKIGEDPMILNIELNNEDSIYDLWGDENFIYLTSELQIELISQWRKYLKTKYKNFDEIYKFYNGEKINPKNNLIENNTIKCQTNNGTCITDKDKNIVYFNITSKPSTSYGNQIQYGYINITNSTIYTITFEAKVKNSTSSTIHFDFQENKSPYTTYLKTQSVNLYQYFYNYTLVARTDDNCQIIEGANVVPKLYLPPEINNYEVKNLKVFVGQNEIIISDDNIQSLDKIKYPNNALLNNIPNMAYDLRLFFDYTERNTQNYLTNYIKNDLKFKDLFILDSQSAGGSIYSLQRESEISDIIDTHNYWQHPIFPWNHMWDMDYYTIPNEPMFPVPSFGTIKYLTCTKYSNKPYTISEYNHPYPNEHLHEKFTILSSWSAVHDFDAIYQYVYDQTKEDKINGYFQMASNPIDFAIAPYVALGFRNDYVPKSKNYVKLKLNKGYINQKMKARSYSALGFLCGYYYPGWDAVFDVEIINDETSVEPIYLNENNIDIQNKNKFFGDTIEWKNTNDIDSFYKVNADKYFTLTGFLGNSQMSVTHNITNLIEIKIKLNEKLNDTCTIGLVSLDNKKLEESEKLLLTVVGKVRNTNQTWMDKRTTTKKKGWGVAPTLAQYIEIECILKFTEDNAPKIYSINKFGELNKEFKVSGKKNEYILKSDENNPTLNYYIIRDFSSNNKIVLIVVFIVIFILIIIAIVILFFYLRNKRKKDNIDNLPNEPIMDKELN